MTIWICIGVLFIDASILLFIAWVLYLVATGRIS